MTKQEICENCGAVHKGLSYPWLCKKFKAKSFTKAKKIVEAIKDEFEVDPMGMTFFTIGIALYILGFFVTILK